MAFLALGMPVLLAAAGAGGGDPVLPPGGAKRVVLFEAYELAAPLGAWDRIVGLSRYAYDNDLIQRLVPNLRQLPSPGSGFEVNIEALLALKPDLVVTWSRKPEALDYLRRRGLAVLSLYPEGLKDLRQDLLRLGQALGREARAQEVAVLMDEALGAVKRRVEGIPGAKPPRCVWLWGKPTIISGNLGVVPELMGLAGGQNLGADITAFNREVSLETLVGLNPEVIFIWGSASYGPDDLFCDPKWQAIQAVRNRRVYKATRASTWSPRVVTLTWWMARHLYPEAITREEMYQALEPFYQSCFGIPFEEKW